MSVEIKHIEYVIPKLKITNKDLKSEFTDYNFDKFEKKVGIKSRFIVSDNESALDLAEQSINKLFNNNKINALEIEYLIYCTQSPEYLIPSGACILQNKLGLSKNIGCFDYNLGCSGYVYGLSLAKSLIESGQVKNVLLVTSETYSKYINKKDLINRLIFGDAASATLIEKSDFEGVSKFVFGTDGSGYDKLIVKNNFFNKKSDNEMELKCYGNNNFYNENNLYMDGPSIFSWTIDQIPQLIFSTLEKNLINKEKINMFILHQANKFLLNSIRKISKIDDSKFYINLEKYGNTVSNTIPISLKNYSKNITNKEKIVLAGFGVGLSWAGTLITIKDKL